MLQNPSKFHHSHPLSHFLTIHNTQAAALVTSAHNGNMMSQTTIITNQHIQAHQQQMQQQQQEAVLISQHHHPQQQHQHQIHIPPRSNIYGTSSSHVQLLDVASAAAHTSLEQMSSKSFTIAAILGLQKSNDYNNAINLSISGEAGATADDNNKQHQHQRQQTLTTAEIDNQLCYNGLENQCKSINKCNNQIVKAKVCDNNNKTTATAAVAAAAAVLVNRYLPKGNGGSGADGTGSNVLTFQQHENTQIEVLKPPLQLTSQSPTTFGVESHRNFTALATATINKSNVPSALQSLQQLHQQHVHQQNALTFSRGEKLKADGSNGSKKPSLKNKRVRTIFTPEQLERLEAEFERQQYMVGPERLYLAHTLQLTEAQVKVWFQNRRIKWRKHHLEITQQRLALLRQTQMHPEVSHNTSPISLPATQRLSTPLSSSSLSPISCGGTEDIDQGIEGCKGNGDYDDVAQLQSCNTSQHASESDLSICNDSDCDDGSFMEASEEAT